MAEYLTEIDWDEFPDAQYFYPETEETWATIYKLVDDKVYRRVGNPAGFEDNWELVPKDSTAWKRFHARLGQGVLIKRPTHGENSWLT